MSASDPWSRRDRGRGRCRRPTRGADHAADGRTAARCAAHGAPGARGVRHAGRGHPGPPLISQVAGDARGGVLPAAYRVRRHPGSGRRPPRGVPVGQLTAGAAARAFWLLLLPFTLANVAPWMRPPATGMGRRMVHGLLRMFALSMSATFTLAAIGVFLDLVGWQCAAPEQVRGRAPVAELGLHRLLRAHGPAARARRDRPDPARVDPVVPGLQVVGALRVVPPPRATPTATAWPPRHSGTAGTRSAACAVSTWPPCSRSSTRCCCTSCCAMTRPPTRTPGSTCRDDARRTVAAGQGWRRLRGRSSRLCLLLLLLPPIVDRVSKSRAASLCCKTVRSLSLVLTALTSRTPCCPARPGPSPARCPTTARSSRPCSPGRPRSWGC